MSSFVPQISLASSFRFAAKVLTDPPTSRTKAIRSREGPLEKLCKVFKWKNYFVVNRVIKPVPSRGSNHFKLSDECTIEIKELEGPKVEVKLIGKGKEVHKTTLTISTGQSVVYSGDDKNQSAWFVIITELEEK